VAHLEGFPQKKRMPKCDESVDGSRRVHAAPKLADNRREENHRRPIDRFGSRKRSPSAASWLINCLLPDIGYSQE